MAAQTPVPGCTEHPGMGFVYVCKTCNNDLICMDCVVGRHNKHDIGKLTEFVLEQTQQIQQYEEKLSKSDIPKVESYIKVNDENFNESSKEFRKMIDDIKGQGEEMKKKIDILTNRLVRLCRDLEKMNEDIKEKNKNVLTKYLTEELRPQLDRCQRVRTSGTNNDNIAVAKEIRNTGSTTLPPVTTIKSAVFQPGTISHAILDRMLGTVLVDGENVTFCPVPPCTVVSSFKKSFNYAVCRSCRTCDEAWLSYWDKEQIYRVDQKGNVKEKIECKVKVYSIAVSPTTGRVWFCVQEDQSIREITSDGDIVTRFSVESAPMSLCITQEDMVVVGMAWSGISLYSKDGRVVTDGAGRVCGQEAELPHHIVYSITTGDVAVVDSNTVSFDEYTAGNKAGKQPRVIVMNKHLKMKFQCRDIGGMGSQAGDSQQSRFYPQDVCFDGAGDVLVAEGVTMSVVLIDGNNGLFLRTIYITDGIAMCISLHDDKTLWINIWGCKTQLIEYRKGQYVHIDYLK